MNVFVIHASFLACCTSKKHKELHLMKTSAFDLQQPLEKFKKFIPLK